MTFLAMWLWRVLGIVALIIPLFGVLAIALPLSKGSRKDFTKRSEKLALITIGVALVLGGAKGIFYCWDRSDADEAALAKYAQQDSGQANMDVSDHKSESDAADSKPTPVAAIQKSETDLTHRFNLKLNTTNFTLDNGDRPDTKEPCIADASQTPAVKCFGPPDNPSHNGFSIALTNTSSEEYSGIIYFVCVMTETLVEDNKVIGIIQYPTFGQTGEVIAISPQHTKWLRIHLKNTNYPHQKEYLSQFLGEDGRVHSDAAGIHGNINNCSLFADADDASKKAVAARWISVTPFGVTKRNDEDYRYYEIPAVPTTGDMRSPW